MSAALFIALEREIDGFDPFVNGKALSRAEEHLDRIASDLGVTPLMHFFSAEPDAVAVFLEFEESDTGEIELASESWFAAEDGLRTVDALLAYLAEHPGDVRDPQEIISDLREFQAVLQRAASESVRWHLAVDY